MTKLNMHRSDVFRNFFKEHGEEFEGAPAMCDGEHDMRYYSLFQTYLKLYEVINGNR